MSEDLEIFSLQEDDLRMMLAATTQLGTTNLDFHMERYVFKRRADGVYVLNLRHTWEKLLLAARVIVTIENPSDVFVLSSRTYGQRPVFKYAAHTGATPVVGRFTPGMFTNRIQGRFREPSLLIVTDPFFDHQPISEASLINIPVIALCTTDTPMRYVDVAIPCNNKAPNSIGLVWWLLAREVLRLRGVLQRDAPWSVVVDLFLYRDPEDVEKDEMTVKESPALPAKTQDTGVMADIDWNTADVNEWLNEMVIQEVNAPVPSPTAMFPVVSDWAAEVQAMEDSAIAAAAAAATAVAVAAATAPPPVDTRESEWEAIAAEWDD